MFEEYDDDETPMPCGIHVQEVDQCGSCYECPCYCECPADVPVWMQK